MSHATRIRVLWALALVWACALPQRAWGGQKNKEEQRGMLEKMEAVPCGANQRGVSGLGTVWASVGITHVNSQEKLCPQYLLRTDDMDYEIRPTDKKDPAVLPVGKEGEFKLKHNHIYLRFPDSDGKTRTYQVVAMNPNHPSTDSDSDKSASTSSNEPSSSEQR
jgi:hypothetical protein